MATTAIGTLIPILDDAEELTTRFGTYLLAAGAVGEFGPILLITFFFSTDTPLTSGLILMLFIAVAVLAAVFAIRWIGAGWETFEGSLETSSQLPIRIAVVLIFTLAFLANHLGLDLLLGGFVAGVIVRLALRGREVTILESKLAAVGYGFLIPFFFVVSGMQFDLQALLGDPRRIALVPIFAALFLVVRGVPAMMLYRSILDLRDRRPWRSSAPPSCRWSSRSRRSRSPRTGCERRRQRRWSGRRSSRPRSIHSSACACAAHEDDPEGI